MIYIHILKSIFSLQSKKQKSLYLSKISSYYILINLNQIIAQIFKFYLYYIYIGMKQTSIQFILFLNPQDKSFYSYSPIKGLLVKQIDVPNSVKAQAQQQIEELALSLQSINHQHITSFQRRPIPLNLLTERKFKYPVYFTEQYLPSSTLETFKISEAGQISKDNLFDYISAKIYLGELVFQLQKSKKSQTPSFVTIDIKLIASVNEVIRTINRVILQDYGIVITMKNSANKLIFKIKDKNEYLYGNEAISNFQYIRESINDRRQIQLEILQVSIYDKDQFLQFAFHRDAQLISRGQFTSFPWHSFLQKYPKDLEFLIWYLPEQTYLHPQSSVDIEKLFSTNELVRNNEKIKLKLQQQKRLQMKKIIRFLWKEKIGDFLQRRRRELKNRFVDVQNSIIYSGECFFSFQFQIEGVNNFYTLLIGGHKENKLGKKKLLKFQLKQTFAQVGTLNRLPSLASRSIQYANLKRKNLIEIVPYMFNFTVQFLIGRNILHIYESKCAIADNYQVFGQKISWSILAKMPLETSIAFKLNVFNKQAEGYTFGVGAIKLFDQYGFLLQGRQQINLFALQKLQLFKIGCINKRLQTNQIICKVIIKLPTYRSSVIWTLSDAACAKNLGYQHNLLGSTSQQNVNLQRLNELLRYDPLMVFKYSDKDKELLRKCKKFYKHQSEKFINYLYAVDWTQPAQIAQLYSTILEWAPLKPIEALFVLNAYVADEKVRYYAVKRIQHFHDYQFVLYSNQITQALVSFETDNNPLIDLILQKCVYEPYTIAQQYFWQFKNRVNEQLTSKRFILYLQSLLMLSSFRKQFVKQININNYLIEMNQSLIKESQGMTFKDKNKKFLTMLSSIQNYFHKICPNGFLFPIRPQYTFKAFNRDQCKMFDSKKLPFSLACIPSQNYSGDPYKIMFKYGDDIKQDNLVLQMFKIFDKLWRQNGLDFKMNIYRTLSTGTQIGFIQLVQAQNNSKIHKDFGKGLVEAFDQRATYIFLQHYNPDKKELIIAKQNYLRSSVGYLVATYVLGIGDRHSGNVMVQRNGKFFHIDFGHILGNFKTKFNIKRQRTPVLFTSQFSYVMGGQDSKEFAKFLQLCSKAFNILRKNAFLIINMLAMMVSAQIPQLKRLEDVGYMVEKLVLQLSQAQAAQKLNSIIKQTLLSQKSRNLDNAFHEANREG